jgi:hypothetical protein
LKKPCEDEMQNLRMRGIQLARNGDGSRAICIALFLAKYHENRETVVNIITECVKTTGNQFHTHLLNGSSRSAEIFQHLNLSMTKEVPYERSNMGKGTIHSTNYYCTYFDWNYAAKGLVMIESLLAIEPNATIFVLAIDEDTYNMLCTSTLKLIPIKLDSFLELDKALTDVITTRSRVEFYFTLTSCLLHYLLQSKIPPNEKLTYLDSDLYFLADIQPLHDEMTSRSAQVIPHNFTDLLKGAAVHGLYNVGWISIRNDTIGREIIDDYRKDCLTWCFDKVDGPLFADQKYLNYWPYLYPNVVVSQIEQANVAPWNIDETNFHISSHLPFYKSKRVIFYHFHGLKRTLDGCYNLTGGYNYPIGDEFLNFYNTYIAKLLAIERIQLRHTPKEFVNIR